MEVWHILLNKIVPLTCVIGAIAIIVSGNDIGWGWLLVVAFLTANA